MNATLGAVPAEPLARLLERLDGVKRSGDGFIARCPAHNDRQPSLSINEGADGRVLVHCHTGCDPAAVVHAVQLDLRDLFPRGEHRAPNGGRTIAATYDYLDADGQLLYQVVRYEPKAFSQRRRCGDGWEWKLGDVERVLYRLPSVLTAARSHETIYVVEGEKDVHALEQLGLVATCNAMGAGKWRSTYADALRGAGQVVVIPDDDDIGRNHASTVAESLIGIVQDVRIVELWPSGDSGADVDDWLAVASNDDEREQARRLLEELVRSATPGPGSARAEESSNAGVEQAASLEQLVRSAGPRPDSTQRHASSLDEGARRGVEQPANDAPTHSWIPRSLIALAANRPEPPTIGGLLYPAKRTLLSGETESLKTWAALILTKAEMDAGFPVAWVDLDAMGAGELLSRLRALGIADSGIDNLFLYYEPEQRLIEDVLIEVCGAIRDRGVRQFVIDAFNPMLSLHGLDPNSTPDIETFWREIATPITQAGAAPTLLDHVAKNPDNRGKYSYGSERKASGAIVHIGFRLLEPFTRGGTGRTLLTTHKDRPGFLPRPTLGRLVLDSDGTTVSYRLEADHSHTGDKFRPTHLMEKVSEFLSARDGPTSRAEIERQVPGKSQALRTAIDVLVEEGYAKQTPGARGALNVEFVRWYREADEDYEPAPGTSSQPRPDLVPSLVSTPSSDLVSSSPPIGDEVEVEDPARPPSSSNVANQARIRA